MNDQATTTRTADGGIIEIRKLTPHIGAEIHGVDLSGPFDDRQIAAIRRALLDHLVIFFRDQKMTIEQHKAFGRRFGPLHRVPNPRFAVDPEVIAIKADETSRYVSGDVWHTDTSCDPVPPLGSILYMHEVPPDGGGDTVFASMYAVYDTLSESMKAFLAGLTAIHDGERVYRAKGRKHEPGVQYPKSEHPVVAVHPETGRKLLFVNRMFTSHVPQLKPRESAALLEMLYEHAASPEFQCRFKWQPGSVAFWDNRSTHHLAIWDYFPHRRFGHRVTVSQA